MHDNWQAIWKMIALCPNDEEGGVEAATLPFFQLDFCGLMWYLFVWNWINVQYYIRTGMLLTMMITANYQPINSIWPSLKQLSMQFQRTGWLQPLTQESRKMTTGWLLVNTFRLPNLTALIISIPRLRSIWPSMNCAAACADRMQRHGLKRASLPVKWAFWPGFHLPRRNIKASQAGHNRSNICRHLRSVKRDVCAISQDWGGWSHRMPVTSSRTWRKYSQIQVAAERII